MITMPSSGASVSERFWENKSLLEMSRAEWEMLCDGCGKCCLHKLEDEDTDEVYYTRVACRLLDAESCRCSRYSERMKLVPECVELTHKDLPSFHWLPDTCAYRLLAEGKPLQRWHPLVSGDADSVHQYGISVRGRTVAEETVAVEDYEDHIVHWVTQ